MGLIASISAKLGPSDFRMDLSNDTHHWQADEPKELGGTDEAPNPYELMLSALSACSAITMKMYANRKEWPLVGVEIHCSLIKPGPNEPSVIQRKIGVRGNLDEEQIIRLLQIADLCPIHKMLESGVEILTVRD